MFKNLKQTFQSGPCGFNEYRNCKILTMTLILDFWLSNIKSYYNTEAKVITVLKILNYLIKAEATSPIIIIGIIM